MDEMKILTIGASVLGCFVIALALKCAKLFQLVEALQTSRKMLLDELKPANPKSEPSHSKLIQALDDAQVSKTALLREMDKRGEEGVGYIVALAEEQVYARLATIFRNTSVEPEESPDTMLASWMHAAKNPKELESES